MRPGLSHCHCLGPGPCAPSAVSTLKLRTEPDRVFRAGTGLRLRQPRLASLRGPGPVTGQRRGWDLEKLRHGRGARHRALVTGTSGHLMRAACKLWPPYSDIIDIGSHYYILHLMFLGHTALHCEPLGVGSLITWQHTYLTIDPLIVTQTVSTWPAVLKAVFCHLIFSNTSFPIFVSQDSTQERKHRSVGLTKQQKCKKKLLNNAFFL